MYMIFLSVFKTQDINGNPMALIIRWRPNGTPFFESQESMAIVSWKHYSKFEVTLGKPWNMHSDQNALSGCHLKAKPLGVDPFSVDVGITEQMISHLNIDQTPISAYSTTKEEARLACAPVSIHVKICFTTGYAIGRKFSNTFYIWSHLVS